MKEKPKKSRNEIESNFELTCSNSFRITLQNHYIGVADLVEYNMLMYLVLGVKTESESIQLNQFKSTIVDEEIDILSACV